MARTLAFLGIVVLAAALRWEQIGRLSLTHFDEGVLVSGAFGVSLHGMWHFPLAQPLQAPPLFPWMLAATFRLTGMALPIMGIYLSAALGVATVAVYFGLLRRLYGHGWAFVGAGLLAASDLHVAFSRMALTDVPLTFWFVIGAYCLVRLTESSGRPSPLVSWSLAFGLAIGAAWNTKYNGWMLAAIAGTTWFFVFARAKILQRSGRQDGESSDDPFGREAVGQAIAWSFGVAVLCFVPWYRHVEQTYDGGYAAVVSNHLRYAGGMAQWPVRAHRLMLSLSAFRHYGWLITLLTVTAGLGILVARLRRTPSDSQAKMFAAAGVGLAGLLAAMVLGCDAVLFVLAAAAIVPALVWGRWSDVLFAVWAGAFLVLTPFYHPYTRLLVPALPAVIGLAIGLVTRALPLISETDAGRGNDRHAARLSRLFLTAGCAIALFAALVWHPLGWLPGPHLWQRWSTIHSYRGLGDAVEQAELPQDATVLCLGVPAMSLNIERKWAPIEVVPFEKVLARFFPSGDCYLAVDFWGAYGENHQLALASVRERLSCLEPIAVVPNDLNVATLLDYLEPVDLERHLHQEWPALHVVDADGREVVFPADLNQPYANVIVLYRIDRDCLKARQLD